MKYLKKLDIKLVKGEYQNLVKGQVREPEQLYEIFKNLKDKAQETLVGVYLDNGLNIRVYDILSVGGESETLALPHEIFRHAIIASSKYFVLIHNHPNGNPAPSKQDLEIIKELQKGAQNLKLKFLDFMIIGDMNSADPKQNYWSWFENQDGGEYELGAIL
jgi:DNA repair protein RadC